MTIDCIVQTVGGHVFCLYSGDTIDSIIFYNLKKKGYSLITTEQLF